MSAAVDLTQEPASASTAKQYYVLALLTLIWAINFIDRNIVNVLLQPIKDEFGLSDTYLGLIAGFGFALLYSVSCLPLAMLADRYSRTRVIGVGVLIWSVMTMACGLAGGPAQLLVARIAVGASEAASVGPSQALLSEYFSAERRARAMAILTSASFLGIIAAFVGGGYASDRFGWRAAFFIAGVPGIVIAIVFLATVRDLRPPSRPSSPAPGAVPLSGLWASVRKLLAQRDFRAITLAMCLSSFASSSITVWIMPLIQRTQHVPLFEVARLVGPVVGFAGLAGAWLSAWWIPILARRDRRWLQRGPAWAMALMAGCITVLSAHAGQPAGWIALAGTALCFGFQSGPLLSAIQDATPVEHRSMAAAMNVVALTLLGAGLGPLAVGALSDALTAIGSTQSLNHALLAPALASILGALALSFGQDESRRHP